MSPSPPLSPPTPPSPPTLKPPFTPTTAHTKVKTAQHLWNTRDPARVVLAYTENCIWRNRDVFLRGREEIQRFLEGKWEREREYRLRKELFCFESGGGEGREGNKMAVQFWYEYRDAEDGMKWKRCYGIEHWTFGADGRMVKRMMSGNDVLIGEDGGGEGRWFQEGVDVDGVELGEGDF